MAENDLLATIEKAFSAGQHQLGLELLREFNSTPKVNPSSLNRQAVIEEQIGDWSLAGRAHLACIQAAPHVSSAYLYAAHWLQKNDSVDAAAAVYSLALEADPTILNGSPTEPTKHQRVVAGRQLLRQYLKEHHINAASDSERIKTAAWVQTDRINAHENSSNYQPQLFFISGLSQTPYHSIRSLEWAQLLQEKTDDIQQELQSVQNEAALLRPYLQNIDAVPYNMKQLAGSNDWSALDLYKDGQINQQIAKHFPKTLAALNEVPTYKLNDTPFEIFFSVLKPGQSIPSHFGQSNHTLTAHLPIEVPKECYLEVNGEQHAWQRGELVLFDDNFEHSAHNRSDQNRIVLIFSIWHPDLTSSEQASVQTCFRARQNWMASRREKLQQLIQ